MPPREPHSQSEGREHEEAAKVDGNRKGKTGQHNGSQEHLSPMSR